VNVELERKKLTEFIGYDEGGRIRSSLNRYARANYKPRHKDKYLEFMNDNDCSFNENHNQCMNSPYFLTLFTCVSQHVMGDCVEECLDKAIDISEGK
tara:strand:- start:18054 stop:18344 length:291 start_codon:yes stop_codon:yes gene_type:complete